jgi:hypothetical protein
MGCPRRSSLQGRVADDYECGGPPRSCKKKLVTDFRAEAAVTEDYVDSYYARTLAEDRPRPALDGDMETEVCVIGGGMAGLATALGLAERGRKVVLLEARRHLRLLRVRVDRARLGQAGAAGRGETGRYQGGGEKLEPSPAHLSSPSIGGVGEDTRARPPVQRFQSRAPGARGGVG